MPETTVHQRPRHLRIESSFLGGFLILFGAINQAGQLLSAFVDPMSRTLELPAGAVVLPGVFLIVAGVGALFVQDWALKLGCVLCLIHLTISAIGWPLAAFELVYVALCLGGAIESWRVLALSRRLRSSTC